MLREPCPPNHGPNRPGLGTNWCGELIRVFGLVRGSAAKYADGVARLGEHRVSNGGVGLKPSIAKPARVREPVLHGDTLNVC